MVGKRTLSVSGVRAELQRKTSLIAQVARARGVRSLHLFGSAARGEEGPESDVDFLVELEPGRSLLDLIGLQNDLSDALGRKIDAVTVAGAKPRVLKNALKDAVRVV